MSPPLSPRGRGALQAFTLIELLTVIAIIGVLAGITFGVVKGVNERAAISQARSELAAIAQALESYKRQYGDYPHTDGAAANYTNNVNTSDSGSSTARANDGPGILFNALAGKRGPKGAQMIGKSFLELSKFTLQDEATANLPDNTNAQKENALLDPWGHRYLYYYKTSSSTTWERPSYILLSAGQNVAGNGNPGISVANDGDITVSAAAEEADNIYANR